MLAISYINREQNEEGLGCLAKAMDLYKIAKQTTTEDIYHNRADQPKGRVFKCYFEGGISQDEL